MSSYVNFNWGQGLQAIQTLLANKDLLDSLDGTVDTDFNEQSLQLAQQGSLAKSTADGTTPMTLAEAAKMVQDNPELRQFIEDRLGHNGDNNVIGFDDLDNAQYELKYRTQAYGAAVNNNFNNVDSFQGANIFTGFEGNKDTAIQDFINTFKQIHDQDGDGDLSTTESGAVFALFDKKAYGGDADGAMTDEEMKMAISKIDNNGDGTISQDELKQWSDFAQTPQAQALQ